MIKIIASWMRTLLNLERIVFSVVVSTREGVYSNSARCVVVCRVMDHFRALGCVVTKTAVKRKLEDDDIDQAMASSSSRPTSSCTAVLKIPLNFPNPKQGKRRN